MEDKTIKILEEIRDLQKETVENQKQALLRNEQIIKKSNKYRKINTIFTIGLIVFFILQVIKIYSY